MQLLVLQMSGLNGTEPIVLILYGRGVRKADRLCEYHVVPRVMFVVF